MTHTVRNAIVALLLIVAVGSGCVLTCLESAAGQAAAAADPHKCCKKNKTQPQTSDADCKSPASEAAKAWVNVAPPLATGSFIAVAVDALPVFERVSFRQFEYSPPDLLSPSAPRP